MTTQVVGGYGGIRRWWLSCDTQWPILAALEGGLLDPNLKRNYIWGESGQIKNFLSDPFLEHMLILS